MVLNRTGSTVVQKAKTGTLQNEHDGNGIFLRISVNAKKGTAEFTGTVEWSYHTIHSAVKAIASEIANQNHCPSLLHPGLIKWPMLFNTLAR